MEIKTTSQVIKFAVEIGVIGEHYGMIICKSDRDKKWVAIDDIIKEINNCIGFGEYKTIEKLHELMESLSTFQKKSDIINVLEKK